MAKRRANGEGNIRKRSDGRWEGRYTAGRDPDTGKVIYKNVLAKTQKECKEKLRQAIEENAKVDAIRAERYTVGQWMDVWFENCAKIKVRPSSHKTYRGYIDNHIKPSIGKIPLNKLSSLDLQKLYKKLLSGGRVERVESKKQPKGLSAKTVRNINQVISSAMDFAIDQKLITANPTDGCALPKLEHREMNTLPSEQLASFLHEAKESGVFEMYYIELATGLRRGELLALRWDDLDFATGKLRIDKQVCPVGGKLIVSEPKTKAANRTIILPHVMLEVLAEYKKGIFSDLMFPSRIKPDQLIDLGYVRKRLQVILDWAGCKRVRFHDLRHTFATMSLENGMDIKTLSAIVGHVSSATTLNTYTHITDEMRRKAAMSIDQGIAGVEAAAAGKEEKAACSEPEFTPASPPAAGRAPDMSSSSTTTSGRADTPRCGQTGKSTPGMSMATQRRSARRS